MKTKIIAAIIAPFILFMAACNDSKVNPATVSNTLQDGTWRISFFWDSDHDETNDFSGYNFIFAPNNVVTANNGSTSVNGTWYVTSSSDDDSDTEIVLYFGASIPFSELNEDWHIIEKSATRIHMRHVSGGGGGTDLLTFEKL